jgi:hypothetical protein
MTTSFSICRFRHTVAFATVLAFQCAAGAADAGSGPSAKAGVPQAIQPPRGFSPYLKAQATGTQNYICLPGGWTFLGPQAMLFIRIPWFNGEIRQQVATHYLSLNPSEPGTSRPTWLSSSDSSAVWAKAIANSTDPEYVAPGAIPWLLLEATGWQRGALGGSLLSDAKYLQRVNTSGGAMPARACTVGQIEYAPYTADYIFYKADR